MSRPRCILVACFFTAISFIGAVALADEPEAFSARAFGVNDGDTCRIRTPDGRQYRVRLFGIDAPESDQPHGTAARDALRSLIDGRDISVRFTGAQTYGRRVARLYVDDVYVNRDMVADGWAWHYDRYTEGEEREQFAAAQRDAQEERVGLWVDDLPIKPECWRRGDRDGDCEPDFHPRALAGSSRRDPSVETGRSAIAGRPSSVLRREADAAAPLRSLAPVERFERFMGGSEERHRLGALAAPRLAPVSQHFLFGAPKETDGRFRFVPDGEDGEVRGITELRRTAFSVGHYDKNRLPAWVAMRWTRDDWERGQGVSMRRPSPSVDNELPEYARGGTSFEFARTGLERGHMAPDDLMESWGNGAVREAMRMSNMVPQLKDRNHRVWGVLEKEIREIVADDEDDVDITAVWTIAGPIFREGSSERRVGDPGTRVPDATYKVVGWFTSPNVFDVRAYLIPQRASDVDLRHYLVPVDEVERSTGLDFFSDLDDQSEDEVESVEPSASWE
jgi:endonuclease YncB( thermonuclease family)/DNA/RNA endonuclease G (NUC1)